MKLQARPLFLFALLFVAGPALAQAPKPAEPAKAVAPISYVRVKDGGSKLRNFPDVKGETVLDAQASALLAVYSEHAGWLEVEPASGMKVWVHGSFVKRTTTPGVVHWPHLDIYLIDGTLRALNRGFGAGLPVV